VARIWVLVNVFGQVLDAYATYAEAEQANHDYWNGALDVQSHYTEERS
jgi:hypothetical protein